MNRIFIIILSLIITFFSTINPFSTYVKYNNLFYGDNEYQSVALYLPKDCGEEVGLMLFIHGGAWASGKKEAYEKYMKYCTEKYNIASASVDYRLVYQNGGIDCDDIMEDILNGIRKVKEIAEKKGVTITGLGVNGLSAGGHLGLMLAYAYQEKSDIPVKFCISNSGPTDLTSDGYFAETSGMDFDVLNMVIGELCGVKLNQDNIKTPEIQKELLRCSPISYVTKDTVPTIITHGDMDNVVPYDNAVVLDEKLTQAGVEHHFFTLEGRDHEAYPSADENDPYMIVVDEFIQKHLKK